MTALDKTFRELENFRTDFSCDEKRKKVGNYLLERTLGGGSFGKVRLASHIFAKEKVAVKVITKKAISLRDYLRKNLRREALMLQRLCHPNIIHLYEVMETENGYYMVLELAAGGEFVKYLSEKKRLSEDETRKFMRQLVSAVDHIHQSDIVHRDIKVNNLLLDGQMNVKIIDFGLGNFCEGDQTLTTQCGSPAFTAPEVFSKRKYGPPVDIWSLGVNMYIMLTGRIPFETTQPSNLTRLYAAMLRGCSVPDTLSTGCQELIQRMLDPRDNTRITVEEIVMNTWLTDGYKEPVPRVGPVQGRKRCTVSQDVVEYMSKVMKTQEKELRRAIHSWKPNSYAAMHDLLVDRLGKGLSLPVAEGQSKDEMSSSPGHQGHESDGMRVPAPKSHLNHGVVSASQNCNGIPIKTVLQNQSDNGIGRCVLNGQDNSERLFSHKKHLNDKVHTDADVGLNGNIANIEVYKICRRCAVKLEADTKIKNTEESSPEVNYLPSDNLCYKCGKLMSWAENADSVMEHLLHLQKFLPNFQDMITTTHGAKNHGTRGSSCNDIVSFLSGVDDETFDRALKLLRGYSILSDPPAPPNSAYEGRRPGKQDQYGSQAEGLLGTPFEVSFRQVFGTFAKACKGETLQRKPGNNTFLNILPPIEKPLQGDELFQDPTSLAEERLLQAAQRRQTIQVSTDESQQWNPVLYNENCISGADILSTIPPRRPGKLRQSSGDNEDNNNDGLERGSRLTSMGKGQFVNSRLRHSVAGDVPRLRNSSLPKHSKPDVFKPRKTTRVTSFKCGFRQTAGNRTLDDRLAIERAFSQSQASIPKYLMMKKTSSYEDSLGGAKDTVPRVSRH